MTGKKKAPGQKKCIFCGNYFTPDSRSRKRQYVCKGEECQKKRRRKASAKYRRKETQDQKAKKRVFKVDGNPGSKRDVLDQIDWDCIRDCLGPEAKVILEEMANRLARLSEKK